ncbi:hypothetical protein BGZ49_010137 [Haplosporangium sp. Z 27]|nr:hypothetical protein BGZ49_010137 [Haplosporangium sp. Z 27]
MSVATTTSDDTSKGPVGGHLTKKQRKEQFDALNALQTQLDVSVSLARNQVTSWLNVDAFSDDEDSSTNTSGFKAATVIQPRQPGLGLGAKFISHKDQMRHVPMNAFESKLKRQMTGGIVSAEIQRAEAAEKNALPDKYMEHKLMMAARRKELQEQAEDEEDSRTRNIGSSNNSSSNVSSKKTTIAPETSIGAKSLSKSTTTSSVSTHPKKNNQETKYKAAVHPLALKASAAESQEVESTKPAAKPSIGPGKKRPGDFFSMYMDERANKMAKKKKKSQAKPDPDDDD